MDPLLDESVARAVDGLEPGLDPVRVAHRLRRVLDPERARAGGRLYELRARAAEKLAGAPGLFLDRRGLEQASDRRVAAARARRIRARFPGARVLDATCGVGGDSMALAEAGLALVAADLDLRRVALARANLRARGASAWVVQARAEEPAVRTEVLVLDPDRRDPASGRRSSAPERGSPAWSDCARLLRAFPAACVKLAPAVEVGRLEADLEDVPHSWQWTSAGGELREVALWTGRLAAPDGAREVLALGRRGEQTAWSARAAPRRSLLPQAARDVRWIAEPDPAVIRAGLVGALAAAEGLAPLAAGIAYLGGERPASSPLCSVFEVLGEAPLDRRRVRELLARHDVGRVTVKKRGHPEPSEALARRLRGPGQRPGLLLVTRLQDGHHAFLVRPAAPPGRSPDGERPSIGQ